MTPPGVGAVVRAAARRAAAPGDVRFTRAQLYFEACRAVLPLHGLPKRPGFTLPALIPRDAVDAALDRLGPVPGLLGPPDVLNGPSTGGDADLFDYGLPRLLVCQSLDVAAMLRANDLPMQSACPVYAESELPLPVAVEACLSPGAVVWVLHDAGDEGLATPARVAERVDLPPGGVVRSLGMRPVHAASLHLPVRRGHAPEVSAVPPARLLRTVHRLVRGIRPAPTPLHELRALPSRGFLTWPSA